LKYRKLSASNGRALSIEAKSLVFSCIFANFLGKSKTFMAQDANKIDVALPLSDTVDSFDKKV